MTREEARAQLRAWVIETSGKVKAGELRDDTPILEQRIISSLHVADLVLFLEDLRGAPLDLAKLSGQTLRSIETIDHTFLAELG